MSGRINRCSHCGCDEPIHNPIDGKLYCNNCGMSLEKLEGGLTMKEIKLKPCPFCGEQKLVLAHKILSRERWYVDCGNCKCGTAQYLDKREAAAVWNRRVDNEN